MNPTVRSVRPGRQLRRDAPAKINLGLRVVGRRSDGYHELESLFVPLDLADEIVIDVREAKQLDVNLSVEGAIAGVPADATNLASRAARGFAEAAGLCCGIRIRLAKQIPTGAGLGGGSSDAGTVLRVLRDRYPEALGAAELAALALRLGADVPFFLDPRPARVSGVGERVEPVAEVPSLSLLLANPGISLATAGVYRAFDALARTRADAPRPDLRTGPGELRWERCGAAALRLENDLEPAAVRLCPPVARLRERIRAAGARGVGMTGSGPTVFGVFDSHDAAAAALAQLAFEPPVWARVAATVESR